MVLSNSIILSCCLILKESMRQYLGESEIIKSPSWKLHVKVLKIHTSIFHQSVLSPHLPTSFEDSKRTSRCIHNDYCVLFLCLTAKECGNTVLYFFLSVYTYAQTPANLIIYCSLAAAPKVLELEEVSTQGVKDEMRCNKRVIGAAKTYVSLK